MVMNNMKTKSITPTQAPACEPIGLVGIGLMGSAIAQRLLVGRFAVLGYDRLPERMVTAQKMGVTSASNVMEIARQCRRIVLSLPDSASVRAVLEEMRGRMRAGQIIIDTTTGDAESAAAAGLRLSAMEVTYLDATISGNRDQLINTEVTVMAGGPRPAFDECQDLFQCFAKHSFHVGDWGFGAKMKLVANLVLGLNRAALAEGLALSQAIGLEASNALAVLLESPAYSRAMDTKGLKMVNGDFTPQARLSQHLKDVRLIVEAGRQAGLEMPLSRAHQHLLEEAEAAGLGSLDNAAIIQVLGKKGDKTPP
jgi:3-hydroxyisobutyrate dehydrogenase-like beta-hydroxyacid dehydrogenase